MNTKNVQSLRKRPAQTRSKNRVSEIMLAARKLIEASGIDTFTMKDIADEAGMKPTALYRYFPNKQAVLRELTIQMFQEDEERVTKSMLQSSGTPREILREGILQYWRLHQQQPYRVKLNLAIQSDPELWQLSLEDSKNSVSILCEFLANSLPQPDIKLLERRALLNVVLMNSAINLVTGLKDEEAELMMEEFIEMTVDNILK